jgi:hypothetical protein
MPHGLIRHLAGETMRPTVLLNTKVQGGAASGLKLAMVLMHNVGLMKYIRCTVHDEFAAVAPVEVIGNNFQGEIDGTVAPTVRWCMEQGMLMAFPEIINGKPFPVKVEGVIGPRWKGAPPLDLAAINARVKGHYRGSD